MSQTKAELIEPQGNVAFDTNTLYVDAGNNRVGIGTTSPRSTLTVAGQYSIDNNTTDPNDGAAYLFQQGGVGWNFASTNIAFSTGGSGSRSERARIDSSGRLLVGTSSSVNVGGGAAARLQLAYTDNEFAQSYVRHSTSGFGPSLNFATTRGSSIGSTTIVQSGDTLGEIRFAGADGTDLQTQGANIAAFVDGTPGVDDMPGRLVFSTTADGASSPTERMRIKNDGTTYIRGTTGVCSFASNAAAGSSDWLQLGGHSATGVTTYTISYAVYTNGNVVNTNGSYTAISDAKLKENIVDASSQWDDLKAIQIRNWNFKEETGNETHRQIGPIAQELEQVCPGLVFETPDRDADGNETGEVTKGVNQSVLYMKAVKALQEAMERIETLEASNADLLARVTALESA